MDIKAMQLDLPHEHCAHLAPGAYLNTGVVDGLAAGRQDDFQRQVEEDFLALDRLAAIRLLATIQTHGLVTHAGWRCQRAALGEHLGAVSARQPLLDALVDILQRAGFIASEGEDLVATPSVDRPELHAGLRDGSAMVARQKATHPDSAGFCDLLEACLPGLHGVLSGRQRATDLLFPGGATALVEAVYKRNRLAHFSHLLVADASCRNAINSGAGQRVRILEVGAGTGATTRPVLAALNAAGLEFDYWFTDISPGFLFKARPTLASHPQLVFRTLNLDQSLDSQGFDAPAFDAVIASNVLHATRDVACSLTRLHTLMRPGGLLVLSELTRRLDVLTLTFGLLDGWWLFADANRRLPHGPLLDAAGWTQACLDTGFRMPRVEGALPGRLLPQSMLTAWA